MDDHSGMDNRSDEDAALHGFYERADQMAKLSPQEPGAMLLRRCRSMLAAVTLDRLCSEDGGRLCLSIARPFSAPPSQPHSPNQGHCSSWSTRAMQLVSANVLNLLRETAG